MTAQTLDGRALAKTISEEIAADVAQFREQHGWEPGIAVVQVGADPASSWYVKQIQRSFGRAGMRCDLRELPAATSAADLTALLAALNADARTNGVIVQMPLPEHLPQSLVTDVLDPAKDVDGI
ncbi:MAG: bifunctional methylenetetrahydrofolate dehydrogenase/methenyltetrahydrofolate cyclohydrolase, partial [Chloroflexi bacterium]|nr:bifunctional methylenetetrahydrofolate dehydrogenase/methenyltetrahydrofolate cyclohydrolase [Chloroflexota bacterium]